ERGLGSCVVLVRPKEERCLRHRELDGHATPCWVLQSNLRLRYRNHQEISDLRNFRSFRALAQRPPLIKLKMKERQKPEATKEKSFASLTRQVAAISRNPNIVLVPDMPSAVDLFHEYVSTATAQSTQMVDVE